MIFDEKTARKTAGELLQIKAIKLQASEPFTWASGWKSPIYCDNRLALSYPKTRTYLRDQLLYLIQSEYKDVEVIAGVATGAIAIAVLVAQELNLPFVYVRPEAKSHGRKNQIEGNLVAGSKVVVIEDLVSTGGSSLKAVDSLRESSADVLGMAAIFTYGFDVAKENFSQGECRLLTLSDYNFLLKEALSRNYLPEENLADLTAWRENPSKWRQG